MRGSRIRDRGPPSNRGLRYPSGLNPHSGDPDGVSSSLPHPVAALLLPAVKPRPSGRRPGNQLRNLSFFLVPELRCRANRAPVRLCRASLTLLCTPETLTSEAEYVYSGDCRFSPRVRCRHGRPGRASGDLVAVALVDLVGLAAVVLPAHGRRVASNGRSLWSADDDGRMVAVDQISVDEQSAPAGVARVLGPGRRGSEHHTRCGDLGRDRTGQHTTAQRPVHGGRRHTQPAVRGPAAARRRPRGAWSGACLTLT